MTPAEISLPASGILSLILMIAFLVRAIDDWQTSQSDRGSASNKARRRNHDHGIAHFWFYAYMGLLCVSYSVVIFFFSKHLFG